MGDGVRLSVIKGQHMERMRKVGVSRKDASSRVAPQDDIAMLFLSQQPSCFGLPGLFLCGKAIRFPDSRKFKCSIEFSDSQSSLIHMAQ